MGAGDRDTDGSLAGLLSGGTSKPTSPLRWPVLALACLILIGSYYCFDIPGTCTPNSISCCCCCCMCLFDASVTASLNSGHEAAARRLLR
jgi:hypothetical protein